MHHHSSCLASSSSIYISCVHVVTHRCHNSFHLFSIFKYNQNPFICRVYLHVAAQMRNLHKRRHMKTDREQNVFVITFHCLRAFSLHDTLLHTKFHKNTLLLELFCKTMMMLMLVSGFHNFLQNY